MKKRTIEFFSRKAFVSTLASDILACIESVQKFQSEFRLILSGGKTPIDVHRSIVQQSNQYAISWEKVIFFFSDERCVASDHELSTYRMANETLFWPLQIPLNNIYRIRGELEPAQASRDYQEHIKNILGSERERFDLALLGMGPDGHTASLFPFSQILSNTDQFVIAAGKGPEGADRISLTLTALNASKRTWIMIAGDNKKDAFNKLDSNDIGIDVIPIKGIQPEDELLFYTYFKQEPS